MADIIVPASNTTIEQTLFSVTLDPLPSSFEFLLSPNTTIFQIDPIRGMLFLTINITCFDVGVYDFTVSISNAGIAQDSVPLSINVSFDPGPSLFSSCFNQTSYYATVDGDAPNGTLVSAVRALGNGLLYTIAQGDDGSRFRISPSGDLLTNGMSFHPAAAFTYFLVINAVEALNSPPYNRIVASTSVVVQVTFRANLSLPIVEGIVVTPMAGLLFADEPVSPERGVFLQSCGFLPIHPSSNLAFAASLIPNGIDDGSFPRNLSQLSTVPSVNSSAAPSSTPTLETILYYNNTLFPFSSIRAFLLSTDIYVDDPHVRVMMQVRDSRFNVRTLPAGLAVRLTRGTDTVFGACIPSSDSGFCLVDTLVPSAWFRFTINSAGVQSSLQTVAVDYGPQAAFRPLYPVLGSVTLHAYNPSPSLDSEVIYVSAPQSNLVAGVTGRLDIMINSSNVNLSSTANLSLSCTSSDPRISFINVSSWNSSLAIVFDWVTTRTPSPLQPAPLDNTINTNFSIGSWDGNGAFLSTNTMPTALPSNGIYAQPWLSVFFGVSSNADIWNEELGSSAVVSCAILERSGVLSTRFVQPVINDTNATKAVWRNLNIVSRPPLTIGSTGILYFTNSTLRGLFFYTFSRYREQMPWQVR